jgi:hypothetical protein
MKATQGKDQDRPAEHHHVSERMHELIHHVADALHHPHHPPAAHHEPTVVEIVDRVAVMHRGESFEVRLDPHITRVGNLERLLPICLEQLGRVVTMDERADGDEVVLTITVTDDTQPYAHSATWEE